MLYELVPPTMLSEFFLEFGPDYPDSYAETGAALVGPENGWEQRSLIRHR